MISDIAKQAELSIVRERAKWSNLIDVDDGTPSVWEDLARRSVTYIKNWYFLPRWSARSAFTPSATPNFNGLPVDLEASWQGYLHRWEKFLDVNPRARIADMMSDVSESNDASSFPYGWEHIVHEWVLAGFLDPAPFYASKDTITDAWKTKLLDAMRRAGPGWVYWSDDDTYEWRS